MKKCKGKEYKRFEFVENFNFKRLKLIDFKIIAILSCNINNFDD